MNPTEAYTKYQHMDYLLTDRDWLPGTAVGQVAYDLWGAVKTAVTQPGCTDWMVTELAAGLDVDREKLANAIMRVQYLTMVERAEEE